MRGARATKSRYRAHHAGKVLPLIGREHELALIMEHWQQINDGEGQMILLTGEAGIGKSRVLLAVGDALKGQPHYRINYQCSPYHTDSALYPVIQQLIRAGNFVATDNVEAKLDKLEALLGLALAEPRQIAPLIAALLGIDGEQIWPIPRDRQLIRNLKLTLLQQNGRWSIVAKVKYDLIRSGHGVGRKDRFAE